jgi:FKBP-type peptidyl-prolyl cis-trans isomerase
MRQASLRILLVTAPALALVLTGCGQSNSPAPEAPAPVVQTTSPDDSAAQAAAAQAADEAKAAELAAKERELAEREAALKQKELEAELAKRDAETAAAAAAAATKDAAARQAAAKKSSAAKASTTTAAAAPKAPATPILVPAGTQLAIEMITPVSTKTSKAGDRVDARLASDLMIGDRRAAKAGASVHGSVTQIISGSKKVGGTATLGITFDSLVANGASVSINAPFTQLAKSETGKDTAKIVGGAAAGAIIGHQVSSKNGSVVGGLLGAAAGTAAAKNTGNEVTLAGGQVVTVATQSSFEARP